MIFDVMGLENEVSFILEVYDSLVIRVEVLIERVDLVENGIGV